MATRKPKIELYWTATVVDVNAEVSETQYFVNWRLKGGNGEVMCQCTQGFRDKTDALRNIDACASALFNSGFPADNPLKTKIVGPGRKPK